VALQVLEDVSINTIIGPGSFIKGGLKIFGFIRIDGDIDGSLETGGTVIVGESARIRGDVRAREITVGGVIQGDIVAPDGVTILSTGMVLGSIITKRLHVADSVILHGRCFAINDQALFDVALSEYYNMQALEDSSLASGGMARF
jgi:cytoskeletal protein CcmA (bactofilin family)